MKNDKDFKISNLSSSQPGAGLCLTSASLVAGDSQEGGEWARVGLHGELTVGPPA